MKSGEYHLACKKTTLTRLYKRIMDQSHGDEENDQGDENECGDNES